MGRPHKCPYCETTDTTSKGYRPTKTMGLRKLRRCRSCGRKFTPKNQQPLEVAPDAESSAQRNPADEPPRASGEPSPQSSSPS